VAAKRNTFLAVKRIATRQGEELLKLHKEGLPTPELAARFECAPSTIIRALRSLGVKLPRGRPQGAKDRKPRKGSGKGAAQRRRRPAAPGESAADSATDSAKEAELPAVHDTAYCADVAAA
jgi:hypothetical protein